MPPFLYSSLLLQFTSTPSVPLSRKSSKFGRRTWNYRALLVTTKTSFSAQRSLLRSSYLSLLTTLESFAESLALLEAQGFPRTVAINIFSSSILHANPQHLKARFTISHCGSDLHMSQLACGHLGHACSLRLRPLRLKFRRFASSRSSYLSRLTLFPGSVSHEVQANFETCVHRISTLGYRNPVNHPLI